MKNIKLEKNVQKSLLLAQNYAVCGQLKHLLILHKCIKIDIDFLSI
jgi:hypothetical protein